MNDSSPIDCNGLTIVENSSLLVHDGGQMILVSASAAEKIYLSLSSAILFVTIVVGIVGNVFVIGLIAFTKPLWMPTNFQLASLAVADLMVCGITAPVHLHGSLRVLNGSYDVCSAVSKASCSAYLLTFHTSFFTSLMSVTSVSISRAVIVCSTMTKRRQRTMIGIFVALSFICGVARGLYVFWTRQIDRSCLHYAVSAGNSDESERSFLPISVLVAFVVVGFCYCSIYVKAKFAAAAVHAHGHGNVASGQHKDQNNMATTTICLTIVLVFLLMYIPHILFFILNMAGILKLEFRRPFQSHLFLSVWLAGSAVDPAIYAFRSRVFSKQARKVLFRNEDSS
ncbi:trace amine-associated receptor 9-like [Ptychodera flava]|uniref:trace amine-associated receptor 9-like n=1 Tax=Ptychodera flava TaxID=63121 RepID=UPI00396AAD52